MNKNYYITHPLQNKESNTLINIPVNSLASIFDCSADSVFCDCLEYLTKDELDQTIYSLLNKLKPLGFITFTIKNIKDICSLFLNGSIPGDNLLKNLQNCNSILTIENIYTKLDMEKYKVSQLSKDQDKITITVERQII